MKECTFCITSLKLESTLLHRWSLIVIRSLFWGLLGHAVWLVNLSFIRNNPNIRLSEHTYPIFSGSILCGNNTKTWAVRGECKSAEHQVYNGRRNVGSLVFLFGISNVVVEVFVSHQEENLWNKSYSFSWPSHTPPYPVGECMAVYIAQKKSEFTR